jgi:hypothetical protein
LDILDREVVFALMLYNGPTIIFIALGKSLRADREKE